MGYGQSEIAEDLAVVAEPSAGPVHSYRDLRVWKRGMSLTEQVYALTASFPKEERFGLVSQLRRAAVSVPSNIAEGWGRGRTGEYVQHLRYARGSLYEVEKQVALAARLGYVEGGRAQGLLSETDQLGRMLLGLMRSLQAR